MTREFMPLMTDDKFFSKRKDFPQRLPWELIEQCDSQAKKNHSQSLETLAGRGGLHPVEAYCIMRGLSLSHVRLPNDEEAAEYIEKKMKKYNEERLRSRGLGVRITTIHDMLQKGHYEAAKGVAERTILEYAIERVYD